MPEHLDSLRGHSFAEILQERRAGIIMVSQARKDPQPGPQPPQQFDNFPLIAARPVVGHIIPGQDNQIGMKAVDPLDAASEVFLAHRGAAVQVARLNQPCPFKPLRQSRQNQIRPDDFHPFRTLALLIHRVRRAESQRPYRRGP